MQPNVMVRSSLAVIVVLGLLTGCGSSSSSSSTSTAASLSKAQYVARGNAICTKGDAAQNTAAMAYFKAHHISTKKQPTMSQLTGLAKAVLIPNAQSQIHAVKALGAPKGDLQTVTAMLAAAQSDLDKAKANPASLTSGAAFAHSGKLLHAYGLKACAPSH